MAAHRAILALAISATVAGGFAMPAARASAAPLLNRAALTTRGGANAADFSPQVARLFENMRGPAALIAGGLVPLGFLGNPKKAPDDSPSDRTLKRLYMVVAVLSLSAEILVVVQSTVAINKLAEVASAPAASLVALISRDHELAWTGVNVNFIGGLLGFVTLLGLQSYFAFGHRFGRVALSLVAAVFTHACSIVNRGIAAGDGRGERLAHNYLGLVARYGRLLAADLARRRGALQIVSLLCLASAVWFAAQGEYEGLKE